MSDPIARLPDENQLDPDTCDRCGDEAMAVIITGGGDCPECGTEIALCKKCMCKMVNEITGMWSGLF